MAHQMAPSSGAPCLFISTAVAAAARSTPAQCPAVRLWAFGQTMFEDAEQHGIAMHHICLLLGDAQGVQMRPGHFSS